MNTKWKREDLIDLVKTPVGRVEVHCNIAHEAFKKARDVNMSDRATADFMKIGQGALKAIAVEFSHVEAKASVDELKELLAETRDQMKGVADGATRASNSAPFVVHSGGAAHKAG